MSFLNIIVNTVDTTAMITDQLYPATGGSVPDSVNRIARYMDGLANGNFYFTSITEQIGAVRATATITSTGTASNNETMSVANQTLTAKTSGAVAANGEFNISGTVATQAANIAAAINAVVALSGLISATSSLGVVTVTATHPGVSGNGLQMSESLTNVTVTQFSGGSNGTATTLA